MGFVLSPSETFATALGLFGPGKMVCLGSRLVWEAGKRLLGPPGPGENELSGTALEPLIPGKMTESNFVLFLNQLI